VLIYISLSKFGFEYVIHNLRIKTSFKREPITGKSNFRTRIAIFNKKTG